MTVHTVGIFIYICCKCLLVICARSLRYNVYGCTFVSRNGFVHVLYSANLHMCVHTKHEKGRGQKTRRVCEMVLPSLCTHLRQTLCAPLCCIRSISSFWSTSAEISSGKWRAWVCLPGTRWDCVIIVGS